MAKKKNYKHTSEEIKDVEGLEDLKDINPKSKKDQENLEDKRKRLRQKFVLILSILLFVLLYSSREMTRSRLGQIIMGLGLLLIVLYDILIIYDLVKGFTDEQNRTINKFKNILAMIIIPLIGIWLIISGLSQAETGDGINYIQVILGVLCIVGIIAASIYDKKHPEK